MYGCLIHVAIRGNPRRCPSHLFPFLRIFMSIRPFLFKGQNESNHNVFRLIEPIIEVQQGGGLVMCGQ